MDGPAADRPYIRHCRNTFPSLQLLLSAEANSADAGPSGRPMVFCMAPTAQLELLLDIEARHEDLLRRLDELDKRVEKALAECQVYRASPSQQPNAERN
jgi:hypothetical protein